MLAYDADTFVAVTGQIAGAWGRSGIQLVGWAGIPGKRKLSGWIINNRVLNLAAGPDL
jgi:hypothetical protein